jgi:hypothetical protein
MSRPSIPASGRVLLAACLPLALVGLNVVGVASAGGAGGGALVAEPVLSATAVGVRELFGASPLEAPGEVWGMGKGMREDVDIVRYTAADGWERLPNPIGPDGGPVSSIRIPERATAGRTTPSGGVATVAYLGAGEGAPEALLVRDPGGQFRAVEPAAGILEGEAQLFQYTTAGASSWVKLAAVDEPGGGTGAFVVPTPGGRTITGILHYDGSAWSREPICLNPAAAPPASCQAPKTGFSVIAIDASGPDNAWLLARVPRTGPFTPGEGIVLLHREAGQWRKQALGGALGALYATEEATVAESKVVFSAREQGQPLTVTPTGIWVDASLAIGSRSAPLSDATIYYDIDPSDPERGKVTGSWCDLPESTPASVTRALCTATLGADLPSGQGRSFAWPGSAPGEFGTRAITGVGQGAMLIFENGAFTRIPLAGNGGGSAGAALSAPDQGWLGPSYRLTREPVPSGIVPWPVPFRRPLTAIAPQPGAPVAGLSSQALAVGARGQVARYLPGEGWQPESLLTGSGARATPNLRGVAWPAPGRAYAVGDEGAMWLWRAGSGLWEADPGSPPNLIRGDFTGIAFDPTEPERGYAVGKQGLLLSYGRRWTQDPLPPGLNPEANLTAVAFAGHEALATWTLAVPPKRNSEPEYIGGLIVNDGSGWRLEPQASEALAAAEPAFEEVAPWRVAGLSDGGAVIASITGAVIERDSAAAPWHPATGTALGYPSALAAIREGGQVRGILSVEGNPIGQSTETFVRASDAPQADGQPPAGQAPLLTEPYPLAKDGFVVRQTATGWRDEQRQSYPAPPPPTDQRSGRQLDLPRIPDPVLALLISPDGSHGWAVGGQTGEIAPEVGSSAYLKEGLQTGSAMRYGADAAPPANAAGVPIPLPTGAATFAVGGNAQCLGDCADLAGTGIGPDVWLRSAIAKAAGIGGLRAFLYTGSGVSSALDPSKVSANDFGEEEAAYARRLGSAAGPLPVFATPSRSDLYQSSLAKFAGAFVGFGAPLGSAPPRPGITPTSGGDRAAGNFSYSFESSSGAGAEPVRVLVLDPSIEPLDTEKQCWLAQQLAGAKEAGAPSIVLANREVADTPLRQLLVTGSNATTAAACPSAAPGAASAYFFDHPERNVISSLSWGNASIPAFGTGTLGYTRIPESIRNQYVSASGFLLASVNTRARNPASNIAPVTARLIPSIGSLAIDAVDGTLLRRSQTALFQALARRPLAGISCSGNEAPRTCEEVKPDSYLQIPARCFGQSCGAEILPEYEFVSSRPDIADFVATDPASVNPRALLLKDGKPVPDPRSGLLCAFNAGQTTVTVTTGGLTYSVPVTVQRGSVERPCGTVPRTDLAVRQPAVAPPPATAPSSTPTFTNPSGSLPPPPPPQPAPVTPPAPIPAPTPPAPAPQPPPAFFAPAPALTPVVVIVPPPPPPAAQTTPPSGTSPVTQPVTSPNPEEEDEVAVDVVHHMNAEHLPGPGHGAFAPLAPSRPGLLPLIPLLALLAATGATIGLRTLVQPDLARAGVPSSTGSR